MVYATLLIAHCSLLIAKENIQTLINICLNNLSISIRCRMIHKHKKRRSVLIPIALKKIKNRLFGAFSSSYIIDN